MALSGYVRVPQNATVGGAPIDAFQADAFRQNDDKFEEYLRQLIHIPTLRNNGTSNITHTTGAPINARQVHIVNEMTIQNPLTMAQGWPLIIIAKTKITISLTGSINGVGMGLDDKPGHLGGSGGAGTSNGFPCLMPISEQELLAGGNGGQGNDIPPNDDWIPYMLPVILTARGGAAGGAAGATKGGRGGGLVVLVAPVIQFTGPNQIDVSGAPGSGGSGSGGGGAVVLIRKSIDKPGANAIFTTPTAATDIVKVDGGAAVGAGKKGGRGRVFEIQLP